MAKYEFEELDDFLQSVKEKDLKKTGYSIQRQSTQVQVQKDNAVFTGTKLVSTLLLTAATKDDNYAALLSLLDATVFTKEEYDQSKESEQKALTDIIERFRNEAEHIGLFKGRVL